MLETIKQFELKQNNDNYLIVYNEQFFKTSQLFFEVLQNVGNYGSIIEAIKHTPKTANLDQESTSYLAQKIGDQIEKISKSNDDKNRAKYIFYSFTILSASTVSVLAKGLSFLFNSRFFPFVLSLIVGINIVLSKYVNLATEALSTSEIGIYIGLIFICLLFHELGHAVAAKRFTNESGPIGFGMYYRFLPVFFADVTIAWLLSRKKRMIVNLGGIYIQLLLNLFLFAIVCFVVDHNLLRKLILINFYFAAYSLFPFFRNDGYWLISDGFKIENLLQKSKTYIYWLFIGKVRLNLPLATYSLLLNIFNAYLIYLFGGLGYKSIFYLYQFIVLQSIELSAWQIAANIVLIIISWLVVYGKSFEFFKTSKIILTGIIPVELQNDAHLPK